MIDGQSEKKLTIFTCEKFGSLRTTVNDDGSISINAEDVACGLGWVTVAKSGNEVIRWNRVNSYCKEFGFETPLSKDDYIPESLFYLLGMKANSRQAKDFQKWIAVEVLPQIRMKGEYKLKQNNKNDSADVNNSKTSNSIITSEVSNSSLASNLTGNINGNIERIMNGNLNINGGNGSSNVNGNIMAKEVSNGSPNNNLRLNSNMNLNSAVAVSGAQDNLSPEIRAILCIDSRTVEIKDKVSTLENTMTIDYSQQEELRHLAVKSVLKALGGKHTPAYKELSKKTFTSIWSDYKRVMNVNSYRNTAVKRYEYARTVLENWCPDRELELMIMGANSRV